MLAASSQLPLAAPCTPQWPADACQQAAHWLRRFYRKSALWNRAQQLGVEGA